LAGVKPGDSLFMAQVQLGLWHIRRALKASKVMVVDSHPDRLKLAEELCHLLTFERFRCGTGTGATKGVGADKGCECVGYQCCDKHGTEHSNITMNELVQAVKQLVLLSCWSFVPKILSQRRTAEKGHMDFDFGQFWMKGQRIATGQIKYTTVSFLH
jgi:threonine dehydrogenase-like Zn-dependent dehydrogenase